MPSASNDTWDEIEEVLLKNLSRPLSKRELGDALGLGNTAIDYAMRKKENKDNWKK
ncbi:MAG: hypothetical protein GOV15_02655, partial [Candidatus Diapherotrites archaeon]|nr:hypothetical protein [Candidatus Diapherotrites archaeon]